MFLKASSTWRQLLKMDRLDLCNIVESKNIIPFLQLMKSIIYDKLPTLPRKCPIMPEIFNLSNITVMSPEMVDEIKKILSTLSSTPMPNGIYRTSIKLYNNDDPDGVFAYNHAQINFRLNEETF